MDRDKLSRLTKDELIELVLAQAVQIAALLAQVEALQRRVAELEVRLGEPPKDSSNSSVPPSRDRKANRPRRPKGLRREASVGRAGGGRSLHPDPDEVVIAKLKSCPQCRAAMSEAEQPLVERYDRIELPKVKPVVTRVERHGGICPCCGAAVVAPAPQGLEPGSPFEPGIVALAVYLRYGHAVSYQRLSRLFADLPGRLDGLRQAMKAQPVTLTSLPQDLRRRYLTPDGRARVEVFPSQPLTESGALRRFVDAVRTVAPNATDMPVVLLESGDAVVGAFERGGTFAIAMISLLLVLVLRSVIDSLLVLLPLALALALTVAKWCSLACP